MNDVSRSKSRLAVAAFVLTALPMAVWVLMLLWSRDLVLSSLLAAFLIGVLTLPCLVVGHVARARQKRRPGQPGKRMATVGLALGYLNIALVAVLVQAVIAPWYAAWHLKAAGYNCASNLQDLGIAFKMYANENHDAYPALSPEPGRLMFDASESLYPEYVQNLLKFVCPQDEDFRRFFAEKDSLDPGVLCDDHSYLYLGYAVASDEEVAAFAEAYRARIAAGGDFSGDLPVPKGSGTGGTARIARLRDDLWKQFLGAGATPADAAKWAAEMPLLIERPEHHRPEGGGHGGYVLYLDGHVEFHPYPGEWPMTETTIALLKSLAG
ncbi:MAG: DUF4190 domain-containing protein [Candidatus Hydrogenedentes bacterium]|nr:DUF4190 domain-containing protein [Candidatus Hydrogenedentota bacterium]